MAYLFIHGYRIKVDWTDALIDSFLFLWPGDNGDVRKIPRNIYEHKMIFVFFSLAMIFVPISWLLSHVPFIWPEYLAGIVVSICALAGFCPYRDYFRALIAFIACGLLLYNNVTFGVTIWSFHVETYLYYAIMIGSLFILWRRFFNWVCWTQIDRICHKYNIPRYDQKELMDRYEGQDSHYGEKKKVYANYQEAINSEQSS